MEDEPTKYSGDSTTVLDRHLLTGREEIRKAAIEVARAAQRELAIFSMALGGELFTDQEFLEAIRQLAVSGPHAKIRILVASPVAASKNASQLLALARQLSSHMAMRALTPQYSNRTVTFIIADDRALIYHPSRDRDDAVVEKVPGTARHYLNQFEEMWEHGKQDSEFRNVPI
ncbi:MAG: hypothetical protein HKN59_07060 [Gammaproteobacteria bacterium]|nr:hypothetical protein [Gammaproteobacteria bacterium]